MAFPLGPKFSKSLVQTMTRVVFVLSAIQFLSASLAFAIDEDRPAGAEVCTSDVLQPNGEVQLVFMECDDASTQHLVGKCLRLDEQGQYQVLEDKACSRR